MKVYYADYYIIGQINQCLDPPENLGTYEFKEDEAIYQPRRKIYRPRYDTFTG